MSGNVEERKSRILELAALFLQLGFTAFGGPAAHIALITDSTCDLPWEYLERYQIQVVPLTIVWGAEQFRDGVDLDPEDFYRRLEIDPVLPTTSQPTPQEIVRAYDRARSGGGKRDPGHYHQQCHERHL